MTVRLPVSVVTLIAMLVASGASGQGVEQYIPSPAVPRILVRWTDAALVNIQAAERETMNPLSLSLGVKFRRFMQISTGSISYHVESAQGLPPEAMTAIELALEASSNVKFATPVYYRRAMSNDTYYNSQWNLHKPIAGISADSAWSSSTGNNTVVAVIDTGRLIHADVGSWLAGADLISSVASARDGNGRDTDPTDMGDWRDVQGCTTLRCGGPPTTPEQGLENVNSSTWHGLNMAGIISATANNSIGIAGVAFNAEILPIRALGRDFEGADEDIIDAIAWATGTEVEGLPAGYLPVKTPDVINLSLGWPGACSEDFQEVISAAVSKGIIVVAAAGNRTGDARAFSPGNCEGILTVAATDNAGKKAPYSNADPEEVAGTIGVVEIAAPGGDISVSESGGVRTTSNSGTEGARAGGDSYALTQGTSGAAAHVSGVAALIREVNPFISPSAFTDLLKTTAKAFGGPCVGCGAGIVNAAAAVAAGTPSTVLMEAAQFPVDESDGSITIGVKRIGDSSGPASVTVETESNTATAGVDYSFTPVTLPWGVGETGVKAVTVAINSDSVYEGDESFRVKLSSPSGAILGTPAVSIVTIRDDEAPPAPPATPASLTWERGYCYGHHTFYWSSVSNATSYELHWKLSTASGFTLRKSKAGTFYSENLSPNESAYYKVRACNGGGCSAFTADVGPASYYDGCK